MFRNLLHVCSGTISGLLPMSVNVDELHSPATYLSNDPGCAGGPSGGGALKPAFELIEQHVIQDTYRYSVAFIGLMRVPPLRYLWMVTQPEGVRAVRARCENAQAGNTVPSDSPDLS